MIECDRLMRLVEEASNGKSVALLTYNKRTARNAAERALAIMPTSGDKPVLQETQAGDLRLAYSLVGWLDIIPIGRNHAFDWVGDKLMDAGMYDIVERENLS